jgi:hypothetical protein
MLAVQSTLLAAETVRSHSRRLVYEQQLETARRALERASRQLDIDAAMLRRCGELQTTAPERRSAWLNSAR